MLSALFLAAAPAPAVAIPAGPALTRAIASADGDFFKLYFLGCDAAALRRWITPDLEFYHDKGGLIAGSDAFVADYAQSCAAKAKPDAWRSRRALVPASLHVDPVPGFGAIATGEHLFYERKGDGPEKLVGRARFAIVWRFADGRWQMRRALSYAHAPASAP